MVSCSACFQRWKNQHTNTQNVDSISNPAISVIIPLFNKKETVGRALKSVLSQSFGNFEIIVVDDGSTDGGFSVVENHDDKRIRLIQQENKGVSNARNRGIAESFSEFVAFLDADDEWHPDFLKTVVALKEENSDCNVFATAYKRCNAKGEIENIKIKSVAGQRLDNFFEVASISDPPFCTISVMVNKQSLQQVGGFPEGIYQGEDLLTWARLAVNNKIAYSTEPLSIFHTGETSHMDKPKRIPPENDIVGCELEKLYIKHKEIKGLKNYIGHWHKMRASIYLRLPKSNNLCRKEIRLAKQYYHNKKLTLYQILTYFPYNLRMKLLNRI